MQEELNQFEVLKGWRLVPKPKDKSIIGTKWIFKNKEDETRVIIRNKDRLVAKGYIQQECFWRMVLTKTSLFIKWM